ncbi:MAG: amidohydrolase family protein [Pirellulaceae bacterium]
MSLSRRQFVQSSAAALAVVSAGSLLAADDEKKNLPIVDCHQHLWDLSKFKLPWIMPDTLMAKNYVEEDYLKQAAGLNVVKAVYMEVDVAADQKTKEANYVIDICKSGKFPTCAAVIGGRPGEEGFEKYILQFKGSPYVKGVRQVVHSESAPKGMCLEETFVKSVQLLGELGMSFDLCMRPTEISDGAKLCDACPDTRFILDHCGNGDVKAFHVDKKIEGKPDHDAETWKKDIANIAKRKNCICKISGVIARLPKGWEAETLAPIINHCLDSFGPDRVIFGSDWPVCLMGASYMDWVVGLKAIIASRPIAEQKKLLHDNAVKFYGLTK